MVTGIGVVAPTGIGVAEHWKNTLAGNCRIAPLDGADPRLPTRVAGQVTGFDETEFVDSRMLVQTDRWTWLALAATRLALADAAFGTDGADPLDLSVVTASSSGGNAFGQREIQALWRDGPRAVSAYQSIGWFYAASSGQISIRHQFKGACGVLVADGVGGIEALASARRLLGRGSSTVLTGGTEAPLSPYALACHAGQEPLSRESDPVTAYRPFAPDGRGAVLGEGGAMYLLQTVDEAARRSVPKVYAEVLGTALTHDGRTPGDEPAGGEQLARAVGLALGRAGIGPDDVDVVFADGAGEPLRDGLEVAALRSVFGDRRVPVTVPKTMTGRLNSGGAALDLCWAALALADDVIPPSVNLDDVAPDCPLELVTATRDAAGLRHALVVARGTGGFNGAAVLRAAGRN